MDAAMLLFAAAAASVGAQAAGIASMPPHWTAAFAVLTVLLLARRNHYSMRLHLSALDDVVGVGVATTVAGMAVLSARLLVDSVPDLAAQSLRGWCFALVFLAAGRVALNRSHTRARRQGDALRRTLVVGAGRVGSLVATRLLEAPQLGLEPVAFLDKEPLDDTQETVGLPVAGASYDLDEIVDAYRIEHVVVTFSTAPEEVLLRIVRRCEELDIGVSIVPRLFERMPEELKIEHVGGLPLITPRPADPKPAYLFVKDAVDRVAAGAVLLLLAPVVAAVAVAIRLTMGSPILFRQARVGRDGRLFDILKFRSMREPKPSDEAVPVAADGLGPGGVEGADRRTRLGAILRRTSIDELPQLINVVRGDMSLVGPRPERPEFVSLFSETVDRYEDRHRVKSGITGWAQVNGLRGKTSIADRAEWDNFYVDNLSPGLDLRILLMTAGAVFGSVDKVE
jgi:exopolysaccharide biosynthesis polyprenyl glycosylphosphotransferase